MKPSWNPSYFLSKRFIFLWATLFIILCILFIDDKSNASVTGECSNCHTMHNSENGTTLVASPQTNLLTDDCVGCHSSSTSQTIVTLGSSRIPIVLNTSGYPSQPLAGGNFYRVAQGGAANDVYGHNVWGISDPDLNLNEAPLNASCSGNNNSCHMGLATDPELTYGRTGDIFLYGRNGCEACHQAMKHHGDTITGNNFETAGSGWYRFLSGHQTDTHVFGIESPDWEQNPTNNNKYQGTTNFYFPGDKLNTITGFCRGCHRDTHFLSSVGGSHVSPWLRHPTDFALPTTGEFAGYEPVANYDPVVPVAWVNPQTPTTGDAVVMCLSCHRAHGSEYPDMLRWDYNEMVVGTTGTGQGKGCFVCHSQKDG